MSKSKTVREASHAGSWYSDSKAELNSQLDGWLASVHAPVTAIGPQTQGDIISTIPQAGARVIIAPYVDVHGFYTLIGW
jgi:predicted class III extradiol MEMO1 family dioxygenase